MASAHGLQLRSPHVPPASVDGKSSPGSPARLPDRRLATGGGRIPVERHRATPRRVRKAGVEARVVQESSHSRSKSGGLGRRQDTCRGRPRSSPGSPGCHRRPTAYRAVLPRSPSAPIPLCTEHPTSTSASVNSSYFSSSETDPASRTASSRPSSVVSRSSRSRSRPSPAIVSVAQGWLSRRIPSASDRVIVPLRRRQPSHGDEPSLERLRDRASRLPAYRRPSASRRSARAARGGGDRARVEFEIVSTGTRRYAWR